MDEKSLVLKAQEGNKHAMNRLLQDNYKALYGFTLKMTANQHLTEDIVQEVCLKAVINIKKLMVH
ncbi:sigma factor [Clostridium sp.]|uniref:sigma factor n=1 Tax=Clostridium sp. TaxID=1506 RepID=UPI0026377F32|nr:sigma factor [Clostridium sp.]